MIPQAYDSSSSLSSRRLGTSFILLALFAGLLGGALALPVLQVHPTAGQTLCHGILMTFFVVCPAALGGFGQWLLPEELGTSRSVLPGATLAGFGFLSAGIVLLPVMPLAALLLWALGSLSVATDVITTCLEGRTVRFRGMSPLAWSLLATASGVVVIAPVLAAIVTRVFWTGSRTVTPETLVQMLHLPETALMLTPALGLITYLLPQKAGQSACWKVAPYVFAVTGVLGPLVWVNSFFGNVPAPVVHNLLLLSQIVPSVLLIGALCRDVWTQHRELDGTAFWALGSLVLFTAGWLSDVMPGHVIDHSAAAFGGVMAICGGFYAWLQAQLPNRVPGALIRGHALLTVVGAICSVLPQFMVVGDAVMGLSLMTFGLLGLFLIRETGRNRVSA
ncbi:cbb3-type cytochrome c oxidase subunit I [Gluconobacter morbifer]|uniref:Cytochrome oxidase subunit I profile domain-containing protein n=1 Tax=Gluconobacter morbifer G707 TaxID=1088869 RepID=G6XGF5_9PROT|nr:cbb3-type cytochrome c oxidase subunit I [Gluconobacter morbifer]EHH69263.1 hypothetical protein GMO_05700 [Gluconobacter morbifer G707]